MLPASVCRLSQLGLLLLIQSILFFQCESTVQSEKPAIQPDTTSHTFSWHKDTLSPPNALQLSIQGIWGANINDVWAIGHSDFPLNQIWHWNGISWNNESPLIPGYFPTLTSIFGFNQNQIWSVGRNISSDPTIRQGIIMQYDGIQWRILDIDNVPWCFSVWGSSSNNLFVGCDSGIVQYYDGNSWTRQETDTPYAQMLSVWGASSSEVYAVGVHPDFVQPRDSTFLYFYKYDGQTWQTLQSAILHPTNSTLPFAENLWWSENTQVLFSAGVAGIFQYHNEQWERIGLFESLRSIHGVNENDIFVGGFNNQLYHFNGDNWHIYDEMSDNSRWFLEIFTLENAVFLSSASSTNTIIYRGYRTNE